jgi:hypothetical protein
MQQVVVAQLTDYQPIDSRTYERLKPRLVQMMGRSGLGGPRDEEQQGPLSQKALASRLNFQPADSSDDAGAGQQGEGSAPTSTLH